MLSSSIIVPPIVEELYFRGYMQGRLQNVFNSKWAIILTAIIFTTFHTQYFKMELIPLLMLASLFFSALILSYVRSITGSIVPGIIAHSLVNIPVIGTPPWIVACTMFLIILLFLFQRNELFAVSNNLNQLQNQLKMLCLRMKLKK